MSHEFAYPLEIRDGDPFLPPVDLSPSASPDQRLRNADAYAAYQERFRQFVRSRRR